LRRIIFIRCWNTTASAYIVCENKTLRLPVSAIKKLFYPKDELNALAAEILAACIEVHKELGPGLLESVYIYEMS
jgi:PD-(D/E)XK nuclease superfamily